VPLGGRVLCPAPRLVARPQEGLAREPVLVYAPAGSGKTVLLADWAGAAADRWPGCR